MDTRSLLSRFVRVEPGEGQGLAWASISFFFLLGGYYIIRPLREEMGASSGGGFALNWLFLGTLAGTFLVTPLFGTLVSKVPRRVFVPAVYHALAASFVAFYVALSVLSGPQRLATARFFFVFVSTFNLLIVSVFWGFLADLFRSEQAKRLFGADRPRRHAGRHRRRRDHGGPREDARRRCPSFSSRPPSSRSPSSA